MTMQFRHYISLVLLVSYLAPASAPLAVAETYPTNRDEETSLFAISLAELASISVVSVSKVSEFLVDAPATVVVITRAEIKNRGYSDLTQLFDDLPGMDMIKVNGDISFKNYWRGYRNSFGSPYLFLLDGLAWDDLYYNDAEVMRAFPMSNIERIEVVYGPVSSVYGANALNGVINVITVASRETDGSDFTGSFTLGSQETAIGDFNVFYQKNDLKLSLTTRFENSDAYPETSDEYEWSNSRYTQDRRLWGGFVDSPATGGAVSLNRHRAYDLRGYFRNIEIGAQAYQLTSGYGVQYAADKVLSNVIWSKYDSSIYGKYHHQLNEKVNVTSVLRYCQSNVPNDAALAEAVYVTDDQGNTERVIGFELWQLLNSRWTVMQDYQIRLQPNLSLSTGFQYDQDNLQKAYERSAGPFLTADEVRADTYPFPHPPHDVYKYQNRIITEKIGAYLHANYSLNTANIFHFGLRYDDHSKYGDKATIRAGYVRHFDKLTTKLLYGEGFQAPSPRVLYGAWEGLGSDPDLKPEESRTVELSLNMNNDSTDHTLSTYLIKNKNTIQNLSVGSRNVGEREIVGVDLHCKYLLSLPVVGQVHAWGYYSYIHARGDEVYDPIADQYDKGTVGDIASHKICFGITAEVRNRLTTTVLGRYISSRPTVTTNPIDNVPGYTLFDVHLQWHNILSRGIALSVKINNLFDTTYFHPGIRTADAGDTPGYFDSDNVWVGSAGWLNSLLPQLKRQVLVSLTYNF